MTIVELKGSFECAKNIVADHITCFYVEDEGDESPYYVLRMIFCKGSAKSIIYGDNKKQLDEDFAKLTKAIESAKLIH